MLKWLRAVRCPWDEEACACAAGGKHLVVLEWLRAIGCQCDKVACTEAEKVQAPGGAKMDVGKRVLVERVYVRHGGTD